VTVLLFYRNFLAVWFLDNYRGRVIREAEASLRNVLSKSCLI